MGGSSLKKIFTARRAALLLTASLMAGCSATVSEQFNSVAENDCIDANQKSGFDSQAQLQLYQMMQTARQTVTGRYILQTSERAGTDYCFNTAMRGGGANAQFYPGFNRADIQPKSNTARMIGSMVHEARHKQQYARGVSWGRQGNISVAERSLVKELMEADARLQAIVFAYEMKVKGQGQYVDALRTDRVYRPMVRAFERQIARTPSNMLAAMKAAMMQFRADGMMQGRYARETQRWAEKNATAYNPNRPVRRLLTAEVYRDLGQTAYGNYMDAQLRGYFQQFLGGAQAAPGNRP